jgi:DNA-binding winged helix-turn-helix (wHTH) protein/TolB-like protein/Flp pilus assembly protein TadD
MPIPPPVETLCFGDFELDVAGFELRRLGRRVKLGRQAMDVLILLIQRRGELVLRSDIADRLWGKGVFVDVESGVNTAISKIRQALRDSAEAPTFVETVSARGYRFVAPVDVVARVRESDLVASPLEPAAVLGGEQTIDVPVVLPDRERASASGPRGTHRVGLFTVLPILAMLVGLVVWVRAVRVSSDPVTLAVLPFDNVGSDPAYEYLGAALTQETSASLAQIAPEHLTVKGRTGRYKVESTIRSERGRVRVIATLVRVKDQKHVWSESYEREPTSILGLEQELSTAIAEQIRGRLSPSHLQRQTQNADAYDAYLKARYLESRRTPTTNAAAIKLYERATALDSNYALAWSSLAFTYASSVINGDARPSDVSDRARDAAARAIAANPNLAEAQFAAGYVNWLMDWNWPAAETAFRLAIHLDPSNAVVYRTLGHALSQSGRHADAAVAMRRTRELEPLEPMSYALSAQVAFQARDYPGAIEFARRAVLMDSELWIGYSELAQPYEQTGDTDLAMAALTDATRFSGGNSKAISLKGYLLAKTGRAAEAREVLRTLEADARERYVPPYAMALVDAGLGETEEVFAWLDKAYLARDVHLIYLPVDPKWDRYRSDPRFAALIRRCGF